MDNFVNLYNVSLERTCVYEFRKLRDYEIENAHQVLYIRRDVSKLAVRAIKRNSCRSLKEDRIIFAPPPNGGKEESKQYVQRPDERRGASLSVPIIPL